jgi:hypothetical protein
MKVKILQSFSGGGYAPQIGEELNVPEVFGNDWIKHCLAEKITDEKETATKKVKTETVVKK